MLQFCLCSLALCLVSNASPLRVCKDLVQEGKLQRMVFRGGGRRNGEQWCWFCKEGQGWISFQADWLPELTQHVVQAIVLPEGR